MPPIIKKALRNRWFVVGLHAGLWFLLYLALTHLGGKAPDFREADAVANPPQSPAPVAGLERLFLPGIWPKIARSDEPAQPLLYYQLHPAAPAAAHHPQDQRSLPGLLPNQRGHQTNRLQAGQCV